MNPAVDEVAAVVQEQVLDAEVLALRLDLRLALGAERHLVPDLRPFLMRHIPPSAGIASSDQSPARSTRPPGP